MDKPKPPSQQHVNPYFNDRKSKPDKSYKQLKRSVNTWRTASAVLLIIVVWIGMGNMNYADQAKRNYDNYDKQKARADYFKSKYDDLIRSGTCLERLPATAP